MNSTNCCQRICRIGPSIPAPHREVIDVQSRTAHIAERVMGHAIGGVEGIYDQHHYFDEKADALQRLAV